MVAQKHLNLTFIAWIISRTVLSSITHLPQWKENEKDETLKAKDMYVLKQSCQNNISVEITAIRCPTESRLIHEDQKQLDRTTTTTLSKASQYFHWLMNIHYIAIYIVYIRSSSMSFCLYTYILYNIYVLPGLDRFNVKNSQRIKYFCFNGVLFLMIWLFKAIINTFFWP